MDIAEFTAVGAKIVEVGSKLSKLRSQRDGVATQITELETELMPLLVKHSQMIAEIAGKPPTPPAPPAPPPGATPELNGEIRQRVFKFLEDAEPGISAGEISRALRLEPYLVRQAMIELSRRPGGLPARAVEE